jgi:L-2-hydroxyglutarate oxidase LhgO
LWSPSTGIVDVHELLLVLIADLEAAGGALVLNSVLERTTVATAGLHIVVSAAGEATQISCRWLINCAGLSAVDIIERIQGYPEGRVHRAFYAKGNYFTCQGARPFTHLVYPMPNEAGLGVHATLDLDGTTRFGPDVEWVETPEYSVDPARAVGFYGAIREYWPALPEGALQPAYAGVRPKLVGPGAPAGDFVIEGPKDHAVPGLVNLLGIESPGLTSSLAIGEHVAHLLAD